MTTAAEVIGSARAVARADAQGAPGDELERALVAHAHMHTVARWWTARERAAGRDPGLGHDAGAGAGDELAEVARCAAAVAGYVESGGRIVAPVLVSHLERAVAAYNARRDDLEPSWSRVR